MYDLPVGSDSGREWVELFNSGSASATLTEWKLFEGSVNHGIAAYAGGETVPGGAYVVVADNPAKFLEDWPAFSGLLFDSAFSLSNTGETLILRCCGSDLLDKDSVTYNSGGGASGDGNALARTSVSGGIFSASAATPGSGSLTASTGADSNTTSSPATTTSQTDTTQQTQTTTTVSTPVSSYVSPPEVQIFADGGSDRTVIVGADTEFYGRAYNRDKEELEHVRFTWNFGDGSTAEGMTVLHHFDYPDRYAVVLNIAELRSAASDVIVVEAEPAQLSFEVKVDGSVAIENGAGRDLDLSYWVVRSFGREFILPDHSLILKDATMHILQKTLGFPAGLQTELAYPNGVVALRAGEKTAGAAPPVSIAPGAPPAVTSPPVVPARTASFSAPPPLPQQTAEEQTMEEATSSQVAASAAVVGGSQKWWFGVLALSFASAGAVYAARHYAKKEWDIVEETGDAV
jgi:hypothetical protein